MVRRGCVFVGYVNILNKVEPRSSNEMVMIAMHTLVGSSRQDEAEGEEGESEDPAEEDEEECGFKVCQV